MKKIYFTLVLLLCVSLTVSAQSRLEGTWKGTMTIGGLESNETVQMELYIQKKGAKLVGRSYITLKNKEVIEMEVKGSLYGDLSLYLRETDFIPVPGQEENKPKFNRKYQLMYMPSIWDTKMEGYWQELTDHYFSEGRRLGKIKLKKMKDLKKA